MLYSINQWSNCKKRFLKIRGDDVVGGFLWLILHNDYKIGLIFRKVSI